MNIDGIKGKITPTAGAGSWLLDIFRPADSLRVQAAATAEVLQQAADAAQPKKAEEEEKSVFDS